MQHNIVQAMRYLSSKLSLANAHIMQATLGAQLMHLLWLAAEKPSALAGNHFKAATRLRRSTHMLIAVYRSSMRKDHSEGATQT